MYDEYGMGTTWSDKEGIGSLYITLKPHENVARVVPLRTDPLVNVDLDENGYPVGVEVIVPTTNVRSGKEA